MRKLACLVLLLCGCGASPQLLTGPQGPQGKSCTVVAVPGGVQVSCPDGTSQFISDGAQGLQGESAGIRVTQVQAGPECAAGGIQVETFVDLNNDGTLDPGDPLTSLNYVCNGTNGTNGQDGQNGQNGTNGTNGTNGSSTTFSIVPEPAGLNCVNGGYSLTLTSSASSQQVYVCNGANGQNGQNGNAGTNGTNGTNGGTITFNLVQSIEPCGAASSPWKEVLLGLAGGQILADFSETSGGQDTRFSFIPNGSYVDTDESGCNFSVSGDGSTWSEIQWSAGSNQYSTWPAGGFSWSPTGGWVSL